MKLFDPHGDWAALVGLASAQHAVIATRQARALGMSEPLIHRYVRSAHLHRVHHGVLALVPPELLTPNGWRMAAVLAAGDGAALSHWSAAAHTQLLQTSRRAHDVTVPRRGGRLQRGALRIHRSATLRTCDVVIVDGIPTTSVARTIFDLAELATRRQRERLLDEAAFLDVLDVEALEEQMAHSAHRRQAVRNLADVLRAHTPGSTRTDGPLGEEMLAIIRAVGLPDPWVQRWIDLGDGGTMIRPDFAWPEPRVILETDGRQAHESQLRRARDRRRDARARRAGWHTLRIAAREIGRDRGGVGEIVRETVRSRWPREQAA